MIVYKCYHLFFYLLCILLFIFQCLSLSCWYSCWYLNVYICYYLNVYYCWYSNIFIAIHRLCSTLFVYEPVIKYLSQPMLQKSIESPKPLQLVMEYFIIKRIKISCSKNQINKNTTVTIYRNFYLDLPHMSFRNLVTLFVHVYVWLTSEACCFANFFALFWEHPLSFVITNGYLTDL